MKRVFTLVAVLLSVGAMMAQEDKVLMTINGEPVMASEFMYIYQKNNQESTLDKKTVDEYVDLFVNFKLKVAEAKAQEILILLHLFSKNWQVIARKLRPSTCRTPRRWIVWYS